MTTSKDTQLPDWWQREKQTRQMRFLIFLGLALALIGYYYYVSALGVTGTLHGLPRDTSNSIAFVRQAKDGTTTLFSIRADGTNLLPLTPADDKSDKSAPAWTPDGKVILYSSNRGDAKKTQIFALGADAPRQLTYGTGRKDAPAANPDGKSLLFVTQGAIKKVNINGTEVEQIIPLPRAGNSEGSENPNAPSGEPDPGGPFRSAAFSSDGKGYAGVQEVSAEQNPIDLGPLAAGDQVARVLPAGASKAITLDFGREVSLAWDPHGNRLLTTYAERNVKDEKGQSVLVHGLTLWSFDNPNKPVEQRLIISRDFSLMPENVAWSPDGTKIAFEAWWLKGEGERELRGIAIMNLPTETVVVPPGPADSFRVTLPVTPEGQPRNPRWSPDGSRLLFQLTRPDQGNDLCVINADLTNPLNLTKGVGDNSEGAWSPLITAAK